VTLSDELAAAIRHDFSTASVSDQDRVMLEYAVRISRDATVIQPQDHEALRAVGFDDVGILQITLIASWFNYINRVADALGVGRE
jgi:alkylhydroperoxidase family enzyme